MMPAWSDSALLLDLDGTLLDLAPTPDMVVVPPGLTDTLRHLSERLGGAVAVVSGRPIEQIDALIPNTTFAVAGEHGGVIRHAPGRRPIRLNLPTPSSSMLADAEAIAATFPGTLLETKRRGFVFHFRAVPAYGPALKLAAQAIVADAPEFQLLQASMAWEIRPRGVDKGSAVNALMQHPPFSGRQPIFIGDDTTDNDGIEMARALGGAGLLVEEWFCGPVGVRKWLADAAELRRWPALPI